VNSDFCVSVSVGAGYKRLDVAERDRQPELPFLAAPPAPARGAAAPQPSEPPVLSVAELDRSLKRLLEAHTADLRVRGEVTGLHRAGSGHCYFTLKDDQEDAIVECVMYRTASARARRALEDGERVVLLGRVTLYPPRGRMQLVVEDVLQTGRGALLEALEKLKAALAAEGLFAPERKQPLPAEPRTIAVLTSRDGAAIHDVVRVAFRRGRVRIVLVPTPVQGAGAAERIAEAVALADRLKGIDAILVTRGGGSAEDLAAYNDERVVRAIAAAVRPIVSAVGHEIDTTLSDLAADARAATPSQAAELLVPDRAERAQVLSHWRVRLARGMRHRLSQGETRLARLRSALGEPRRRLLEHGQHFDELTARMERAMRRRLGERRARSVGLRRRLEARHPQRVVARARAALGPLEPRLLAALRARLSRWRGRLEADAARLDALSPLAVLERGYAIATTDAGQVLRDAADASPGQRLRLRLHRGAVRTRVESADAGEPEPSDRT
jgi:exodeoxyribonuclease VII large subunit